ncbi:hypothetical protein RJ639_030738 [Escallonia herrerae]|uniref:Uncharacterized protein n=1 Tax=Escallonia herrerae TaxID=1293975 RepID=A0AA88WY78_9ASTE|nr:hypothetical protein RJ639_030738 [Escallonia herrerae]
MTNSSSPFHDPPRASRTDRPVIEELDTDDEGEVEEEEGHGTEVKSKNVQHRMPRIRWKGHSPTLSAFAKSPMVGVIEESKQADRTTGQAAHRISRGIHDKGHSVTRKLNSDGKVDTVQTLHNLNEDELGGSEQDWEGNIGSQLSSWNEGFGSFENPGAGDSGRIRLAAPWSSAFPFADTFGRAGRMRRADDAPTYSTGRPKKVVTIQID